MSDVPDDTRKTIGACSYGVIWLILLSIVLRTTCKAKILNVHRVSSAKTNSFSTLAEKNFFLQKETINNLIWHFHILHLNIKIISSLICIFSYNNTC